MISFSSSFPFFLLHRPSLLLLYLLTIPHFTKYLWSFLLSLSYLISRSSLIFLSFLNFIYFFSFLSLLLFIFFLCILFLSQHSHITFFYPFCFSLFPPFFLSLYSLSLSFPLLLLHFSFIVVPRATKKCCAHHLWEEQRLLQLPCLVFLVREETDLDNERLIRQNASNMSEIFDQPSRIIEAQEWHVKMVLRELRGLVTTATP